MPSDREIAVLEAVARLVTVYHEHEKESLLATVRWCEVVDGELLIQFEDNAIFALFAEEA